MNFFLGCVGVAQVTRIFLYRRSLDTTAVDSVSGFASDEASGLKKTAEELAEEAKNAVTGA